MTNYKQVTEHYMNETIDMSAAIAEARLARYQEQSRIVKRGMRLKAEAGGTVGRAPLGYVNKRIGKEAWVEIDPVLGPLVKEVFGLATTGRYSLRQLCSVMADKGLVGRSGRPLGPSTMRGILANPFYCGLATTQNSTTLGRHREIISMQDFVRVQKVSARSKKPGNTLN
jgi:site-specific DNA recombinase